MECPPYFTPVSNSTCSPTCPLAIYSNKQYNSYFWLNFSAGMIAIFTSLLTGIPYAFLPRKRKWPQPLFLGIFICVFFLGLQQLVSVIVGRGDWRNTVCKNKTTVATRDQPYCLIQATWVYSLSMIAILLWHFICIHLAAKVRAITLPATSIQVGVVLSTITIVPLVPIILAIANDAIEGNPSNTGCFISATKGWWLDGAWHIPLTVLLSSGLIFILVVSWTVSVSHGWIGWKAFLGKHWRVLLFLFVAFVPIMDLNSFRLWYRLREDKVELAVKNWLTCLGQTFVVEYQKSSDANLARDLAKTVCQQLRHFDVPSYSLITFIGFSVMLAACTFPIIFFFQEEVIVWWKQALGKWGTWIPIKQTLVTLSNIQSGVKVNVQSDGSPARLGSARWDNVDFNNSDAESRSRSMSV